MTSSIVSYTLYPFLKVAVVTPEILSKIRRIQIQTARLASDLLVGAWHSAFKGRGMEFEEVRAYTEGDEVRDIDWHVTARMQGLYVKRFREERELTVMLVVDVSASALFGSMGQLKSERIAEIASVLAFSAIKNNDKVGLILFSDRVELYIPPKKGVRHVLRVIREILAFKAAGVKTDLTEALRYLGGIQRKSCICFMITDLLCEASKKEIELTAKKHDLVSIVVVDPHELVLPEVGLAFLTDLETGETRLVDSHNKRVRQAFEEQEEKRLKAHAKLMAQVSAGFVTIRMDQSYVEPLKKYFKQRKKR